MAINIYTSFILLLYTENATYYNTAATLPLHNRRAKSKPGNAL